MKFFWLLRHYRSLRTGATSTLHFELCKMEPGLTLRRDFACAPRSGKWYIDPFLEVATIPPTLMDRITTIDPRADATPEDIIDAICRTILALWKPDKVKIVFHSSGWDGRILSGCIRKLYRERGDEWLGRVLFLSNRWEAPAFRGIMNAGGWRAEQYAACDEGPADMHYADALDFDHFWYRANAPFPFPGLFWQYLVEWAQQRRLLPTDTSEVIALNGQGMMAWRYVPLGMEAWFGYQNNEYYAETSIDTANGCHRLFPLISEEVMAAIAGYRGGLKPFEQLRPWLAKELVPEAAHVPNMHLHDHSAIISEALRAQCKKRFDASWYAKSGKLGNWETPKTANIDPRWGQYGMASLCEHLIHKGVNLQWL